MKNIKFYNLYLFISTFTRNIIDIYSVVFLYQSGFSIRNIIAIYAIIYFLGIFISTLSLKIGNKIGYKYILILSSIISALTFYLLNHTNNGYLIALFLSLSIFTYHPIKHYYGITLLNEKKKIGISLILIYLASFLSSYFVIKKLKTIYLIIITIIGIIPSIFIKRELPKKIVYPKKIPRYKLRFFIFDQFKILFILLEPLYLYLVSKTISYVGFFNIIITISSILYLYFISNKINLSKSYKYLNLIFVIVLIFKLNITNQNILLIIAFLEGIGIKTNELVSTMNLYNVNKNREGYLILSEVIFCLTRTIFLCVIYLFNVDLTSTMYIFLFGIFLLSFQYREKRVEKNR